MKQSYVILFLAAAVSVAGAQTAAKKPATTKPATVHGAASGAKQPGGIPAVRGVIKTAFALRYEDIKLGTGAPAEPNKVYRVHYTGWLATTGQKFDSSYDHPVTVTDKDGMPVMGPNGLPKTGPPQPINFPQGFGRVIPGFDQGFHGMRVGGKRRLFIPWQLGYGEREHPGIPPRSDLIFDVELVDVVDMKMPANHPAVTSGASNPIHSGASLPAGHIPVTPVAPSGSSK